VLNVTSVGGDLPGGPPFDDFDRRAGFGVYGTAKAALNRLTKSFAAELYDDGIAVNAAAPSNPVATPGAGTLDLAKVDTEDISLITETAYVLCTGDPKTLTGRIAHTQPFSARSAGCNSESTAGGLPADHAAAGHVRARRPRQRALSFHLAARPHGQLLARFDLGP
jgi:NAD(P)-dependent dehydrogenase (short-subunit alcohol dehydrogenase family)